MIANTKKRKKITQIGCVLCNYRCSSFSLRRYCRHIRRRHCELETFLLQNNTFKRCSTCEKSFHNIQDHNCIRDSINYARCGNKKKPTNQLYKLELLKLYNNLSVYLIGLGYKKNNNYYQKGRGEDRGEDVKPIKPVKLCIIYENVVLD